jgi:hypothetical protein
VFGPHQTIGFTFPALRQNVQKSDPKGPSFGTLWPPKSEKCFLGTLQQITEK